MSTIPNSSTLRARGLRKVYRGRAVVDGVDLELHQGEIVGLLGPNGAGKTTSFYMIVGFITPDGGGKDLFAHFSEIQSTGGFRSLAENQKVEFEVKQGQKGPQASNIKALG